MQVYWTNIGENAETNDLLTGNMFQLLPKDTTCTQFNKSINQAAGINSVTNKMKNKGWFHHIQDILLPLIDTRGGILTQHHTHRIGKGDISFTKK